MGEGVCHAPEEAGGLEGRQGPRVQPVPQRAAIDELEGQPDPAPVQARPVDLDDVGVAEVGGRPRLSHQQLVVTGRASLEDLQGHPAAELRVSGEPDLPHAPGRSAA